MHSFHIMWEITLNQFNELRIRSQYAIIGACFYELTTFKGKRVHGKYEKLIFPFTHIWVSE